MGHRCMLLLGTTVTAEIVVILVFWGSVLVSLQLTFCLESAVLNYCFSLFQMKEKGGCFRCLSLEKKMKEKGGGG